MEMVIANLLRGILGVQTMAHMSHNPNSLKGGYIGNYIVTGLFGGILGV